jgi:hypothetical protein
VLLAGFAGSARADLEISITPESPTIGVGGTGTIDVYATWVPTISQPSSVQLNTYSFALQITQTTGTNNTNGFLQFSANQSFSYLNDPSYIFYGVSNDYINGGGSPSGGSIEPPGMNSPSVYYGDTFQGLDSTNTSDPQYGNAAPVSLSSGQQLLLASLTLSAPTNEVTPGNAFQISLVPIMGDGSQNSSNQTYFDVFDYNPDPSDPTSGTEISHVPFINSAMGTVTITAGTQGPAIVPEPASTITSLTGAALFTAYGLVRLRRSRRQPA